MLAGAPSLTLDGTQLQAQRATALRERVETLARLDRLLAEVRNDTHVAYRPALLRMRADLEGLDADDYNSDPSGNSGERIACGVIAAAQ